VPLQKARFCNAVENSLLFGEYNIDISDKGQEVPARHIEYLL
jgi:hypothetical protein